MTPRPEPDPRHQRVVGASRSEAASRRPPGQHQSAAEAKSLDFVQRIIISSVVILVLGTIPPSLAVYLALFGDQHLHGRSDVIGLWIMSGIIGVLTVVAVLVINRRRPNSFLVLLGLLPMIISAFWIFG